jgi:hypothetical protein
MKKPILGTATLEEKLMAVAAALTALANPSGMRAPNPIRDMWKVLHKETK